MITYRDYLVWTAAHTAAALNEAVRKAMDMDNEGYGIIALEATLRTVGALAAFEHPNPDRVLPRPVTPE